MCVPFLPDQGPSTTALRYPFLGAYLGVIALGFPFFIILELFDPAHPRVKDRANTQGLVVNGQEVGIGIGIGIGVGVGVGVGIGIE